MAVSFDAFAPYEDELTKIKNPGAFCHVQQGTVSSYLVSLCQDGHPFPAGQLKTVETKTVDDVNKILTVVEQVGFETKRRYGRDELKTVIASRSYSYPVWFNNRQNKFCPGKGVKLADLKAKASWLTPEGKPIEIWCYMVPVETISRYGFTPPTHYIGNRAKKGTRIEGRENATLAAPNQTKSLDNPVETLVNPPSQEIVRSVELAEAPSNVSTIDTTSSQARASKLDLD